MTQVLAARRGEITPEIHAVAAAERVLSSELAAWVAEGTVVIPANKNHEHLKPCGIGQGLRTKVNANLGTSSVYPEVEKELQKLAVAVAAGANTVMDLSSGGNLERSRREIIKAAQVPVGTVPVYEVCLMAQAKEGAVVAWTEEELFETINRQAEDGVDFMTVHCGVTLETLAHLQRQKRITEIVSRGGAFLAGWMLAHARENPLYTGFDRLLEIALAYDVTLSLGDGLRPGCLADATDRPQVQELIILGELVERAREKGVQVMVEGPGHVPLNQIASNVALEKSLCRGAPFYVLGPLVTDVAPGYDHLTAAIGGALAGAAGADFLCYVTPAEHLGLPSVEDVREGVIAARIAAHAADLVKGVAGAWEWDQEMARARKARDWEKQLRLALDPEKAQRYYQKKNPCLGDFCSMCGEFCAFKLIEQHLQK